MAGIGSCSRALGLPPTHETFFLALSLRLPDQKLFQGRLEVIHHYSRIFDAPTHKKVDPFSINHVAVPDNSGVGHEPDDALFGRVAPHRGPENANFIGSAIINARPIQ